MNLSLKEPKQEINKGNESMEEKNRNNLDKIKPEYIQEVNLTLIQYTSAFTQKLIKI